MELRFLGTGPAVGIPRPNHTDAACKDARNGGKSRRRRSAALLRDKKTTLLIDAGPDIWQQLEESDPDAIDAVLLTHGHSDACGGLDLLNRWAGHQPYGTKIPIITDEHTARTLKRRFAKLACLQFVPVKPFDVVEVGTVSFLPVPVDHSPNAPTFGYVFEKKLAYASDFADIPPESAKRMHGLHTLVLDGTFYFQKKVLPTHLTTDEAVDWGRRLKAKHVYLTQIGHTYPPHTEAEARLKRYVREKRIETPVFKLAYDGLKIRV